MTHDFSGKVALVTGATNGMGKATAIRLAREGAIVAVNHRPTSSPEDTLRLIREAGGEGFPVACDMRYPDQIIAMVAKTASEGGRLDYLVSNAAINPLMKWDETTVEDYDLLQEVNQRGTWVVCQESAKQMIKEGHGGAIVTISSISAYVAAEEQTAYCATKAAILMMTKGLAQVLGRHNIRVNSILPGAILTNMSKALLDDPEVRNFYEENTPLGRIGMPEEIASVVSFLLSEDASFMTSASLLVDGGFIVNVE